MTVTIGTMKALTFVLIRTNALAAYDHPRALEIYSADVPEMPGSKSELLRYVLVPEDAGLWQEGRNSSGMFYTEAEELDVDARYVETWLSDRLFGRGETT